MQGHCLNFFHFLSAKNTPRDTHKTRKTTFSPIGNPKNPVFEKQILLFFSEKSPSAGKGKKNFQLKQLPFSSKMYCFITIVTNVSRWNNAIPGKCL